MSKKELVQNFFIEVPVSIYERRVIAFFGEPNVFREQAEGFFDDPEEWVDTCRGVENCGGFCIGMMDDSGPFELVFINATIDRSLHDMVIWHECLHATIDILGGIGSAITLQEQEPAAYLQGFIATRIINEIEKQQKDAKDQKKRTQKRDKSAKARNARVITSTMRKRHTVQHSAMMEA
ncbi:hypothetical protein JCM19235_1264 [Vibrio maritimus]|uniref:Uncharacterized protein n=1 Tax=Vibrio maritimus TaxID=990268 RepID=A0A090S848_9VIBR|nr:hypothetical protein JCM19235_1264 [Vibrio maritimus]